MFVEFENQTWTPSDASVVASVNSDFSIDNNSRKIVWTEGINQTMTITFDSVLLSDYEEISFYLSQSSVITPGDLYTITVDGEDYSFTNMVHKWNHILIDCSGIGATTTIVITSLIDDLTLFIDVLGYRRTSHNADIDVLQAVKNTISLSYGVSTTLSANAAVGATSISLNSTAYINNSSALELDDGAGTTEIVYLTNKQGALQSATVNAFSSGDTVTVLCPTVMDDYDNIEPDPICGVTVYDMQTGTDVITEHFENGAAKKVYTGSLGVCIYIDCSSKKKVLQLSREFQFKYGDCFRMLLDGEQVSVWLEESRFVDDLIGNNPRIAYYYEIEPQPYTVHKIVPITSLSLEVETVHGETIL